MVLIFTYLEFYEWQRIYYFESDGKLLQIFKYENERDLERKEVEVRQWEIIQGRDVRIWEVIMVKRGEDGGRMYRIYILVGCRGERKRKGKDGDKVFGFFKLLF